MHRIIVILIVSLLLVLSCEKISNFDFNKYNSGIIESNIDKRYSIYDCNGEFSEYLKKGTEGVLESSNLKTGDYIIVDNISGESYLIEIEKSFLRKTYRFNEGVDSQTCTEKQK